MPNPTPNKNDGNVNRTPVKYNVYSGATGATAIATDDEVAMLTKSSAGSYTLAAPTSPDLNGQSITMITTTAAAHVVTGVYLPTGTTLTFTAAIGNQCTATAYGGVWYVNLTGVTLA